MHKTADTVEMRYNHSCNTLYSGDLFPGLNQEVSMWLMGDFLSVALHRKSKDWLAWNQHNARVERHVYPRIVR